jgi:hypothetical protein
MRLLQFVLDLLLCCLTAFALTEIVGWCPAIIWAAWCLVLIRKAYEPKVYLVVRSKDE